MSKKASKNLELTSISAKNDKQKRVLSRSGNQALIGSAGTGKTFLACYKAYAALKKQEQEKVIFIRSAVPTRDIGFLPGTENEKISVYKRPFVDITNKLFECGTAYESLEQKREIKFIPTSFVRGNEFVNSFIVVDECQNMTFHELDSLITRLDETSRIIFCGDTGQADLRNNGLEDFLKILRRMEEFQETSFDVEDVVRSSLVKNYLRAKNDTYNPNR